MPMIQTLRWFGPADPVSLRDIRQSGAAEVVTALHEVPNGETWTAEAIAVRRTQIESAGLGWTVVESLPVHESIKTGGPDWARLVENYRQSLRNLAAGGIRVVTYNFMPLRFEPTALAAYDIHILRRSGAERDYAAATVDAAERRHQAMSDDERRSLERTILAGLPGKFL